MSTDPPPDLVVEEVDITPNFPDIAKERLYSFLQDCSDRGETQAKRNLRQ